MKMVMIHGISQEGSTEAQLLQKWCGLINSASPGLIDRFEPTMAYYGKELARWTDGKISAVPMGVGQQAADGVTADELNFLVRALEQVAVDQGLGDSDMAGPAGAPAGDLAVPMGTWLGARLVDLTRALEGLSPLKGELVLRVVRQAYTYLAMPGAGPAVDALVRPRLGPGKYVVVSHSLGTVVAFKLLRQMEKEGVEAEIPLFITMGSPLAIDAVKSKLGPPRKKPNLVSRWLNLYDPADFVALGKPLSSSTFAAGIENVGDVDNETDNAHGIVGYLPDPRVIQALTTLV